MIGSTIGNRFISLTFKHQYDFSLADVNNFPGFKDDIIIFSDKYLLLPYINEIE